MNRLYCSCAIVASTLVSPALAASLYTYFPANATINYAIPNNAVVGYDTDADYNNGAASTNPTSPAVNVVTGADVADNMYIYNSSTVNMNGGAVEDGIETYNNASLTFSGGQTFSIDGRNNSNIVVSGGSIPYGINVYNNSTLTINNGTIGGPIFNDGTYAGAGTQITVTGGTFHSEIDLDGGSALITGGSLNDASAQNHAMLTIGGGTFSDNVDDYSHSTLLMTAGEIDDSLTIDSTSSATISGGLVEDGLYGAGTVVIRGGTFTPANNATEFYDTSKTSFTFVGTGLSAVDAGPDGSGGENYLLSGVLADGSSITGDIIDVQSGATMFTLQAVPEPSSLFVLGVAGAILCTRRKSISRRSA